MKELAYKFESYDRELKISKFNKILHECDRPERLKKRQKVTCADQATSIFNLLKNTPTKCTIIDIESKLVTAVNDALSSAKCRSE